MDKNVVYETRILWNKLDGSLGDCPNEQGMYLICDNHGNISKACYMPDGKDFVLSIANDVNIVWEDNMEDLTDNELIALLRDYSVWYEWRSEYSDYGQEDILIIHRDNPAYWTNLNIKGPCDEENTTETTE